MDQGDRPGGDEPAGEEQGDVQLQDIVQQEGTFAAGAVTYFRRSVVPAHVAANAAANSPADSSAVTLGIVHGYGDHSGRYLHFMKWMAQRGVACHGVDLRGQGKSSGSRGYVRRWTDYLDDLTAFLNQDFLGDAPLFLLGQSHGGLVITIAAERGLLAGARGKVRGCVLCSPFYRNAMQIPPAKILLGKVLNYVVPWMRIHSGVKPEWLTSDEQMKLEGENDPLVARAATPRWYHDLLPIQKEALARAADFRLPLLLAVGDADPLAQPQAAIDFFAACGSVDKALQVYRGQVHELLRETRRAEVFSDIRNWLRLQCAAPRVPSAAR